MNWTLFMEYMLILDVIWPLIEFSLPPTRSPNALYERKEGGGRKRTDNRILLNTILYALMTGAQWNSIYPDAQGYLCKGKTAHKWLMIWSRANFFEDLMQAILILYDIHRGLRAKWLSIDCNLYKAPLGGEKTGRNPTDRGKLGGKRSVCVEEDGIVLSFVHAGANVHDSKLLEETLRAIKLIFPDNIVIHVCLDAGYVGCEGIVDHRGLFR